MAESRSKSKSPLAQDRQRKKKIFVYAAVGVLAVLTVGLLTSFIYKTSRGEKWQPLAFLFGTTEAPTLPVSPTIAPIDVLISIADSTTTAPSASVSDTTKNYDPFPIFTEADTTAGDETAAPVTDEPTAVETTPEETTTEEPTTEEPTTEEPTTEEPTTEEPTTEEPTTEEPTTEEPTTEAPTTEAPTTEAPTTEAPTTEAPTTEEPTTEAPVIFDGTDLAAHLEAAGLSEDQLTGSQLVIVRGTENGRCLLYFFEKDGEGWSMTSAVAAANGNLGEDGIRSDKLPGDKVTPAGYFSLGPAYGMASSAITSMEYHQLQSGDIWVTDPSSAFYNSLRNDHEPDADWKHGISMVTQDGTYKYAVLVQYNMPETDPARGVGVFLNMNSGSSTDGSIGLMEVTMFTLLQWLSPDADPHILIYRGQN